MDGWVGVNHLSLDWALILFNYAIFEELLINQVECTLEGHSKNTS